MKLGAISLLCVAIELGVSMTLMTWLGKSIPFISEADEFAGGRFVDLRRLGNHCRPGGDRCRREEDASYAIAAILSLGAISLFAFPVIGHWLHLSDYGFGLWAGLAVDNTAEATAAGALFSDAAGKIAVLAKTARNATIGFVVLGYAMYWASRSQTQIVTSKAAFLWQKFPKFVLGFLAVSACATAGLFSKPQLPDLANLSRWAFLLTFAGVGLRTDIRQMSKQGVRPFIVGAAGEIAIAIVTLVMVIVVSHIAAA